jgi:hypothetical protein
MAYLAAKAEALYWATGFMVLPVLRTDCMICTSLLIVATALRVAVFFARKRLGVVHISG